MMNYYQERALNKRRPLQPDSSMTDQTPVEIHGESGSAEDQGSLNFNQLKFQSVTSSPGTTDRRRGTTTANIPETPNFNMVSPSALMSVTGPGTQSIEKGGN